MNNDVVEHMKKDAYANMLGLTLQYCQEGMAEVYLTVYEDMLNFHGSLNGGVIFSLADYAFAVASNSYGQVAVGLNVHMSYLAPGKVGDKLICTATETKKTPKIAVYQMIVKNESEEIIATMEGMVYRKKEYFGGVT